jgi:drug/metabolite transporter (DMT)-like permease
MRRSPPSLSSELKLQPHTTRPPASSHAGTDAAFFLTSLLAFAGVFHVTAVGTGHASPLAFAAFQRILPLVVMLALLRRGWIRLPRTRLALVVAASGILSVGVFTAAVAEGITRAGAGNAAVLANSMPLWIALASVVIFRERLRRQAILGLVLGLAGLIVMFWSQLDLSGGNVAVGMAIIAAGAIAYSAATILVKLVALRDPDLDPVGVMALQHLAACPALLVVASSTGGLEGTDWSGALFWFPCIAAGLLSVTGATAYVTSLKRRSATHTSLVLFLVPVVALVIEILFGRMPDAVTFSGMGIVILGVGLVTRSAREGRERRPVLRPRSPLVVGAVGSRAAVPAFANAAVGASPGIVQETLMPGSSTALHGALASQADRLGGVLRRPGETA